MTKVLVIFRSICRFDPKTQTRAINIRTGTKYAEAIGVKREWIHPWRPSVLEQESFAMYFDIAVMELGNCDIMHNYSYIHEHISRCFIYRKVASTNASRFVTRLVYMHTQNYIFLIRSSSRL